MENIELKLYTVTELRDWLIHNHPTMGLSEALISRQRAYAITMNPYVKEDMPIVSALFVDNEIAAYTACFPDTMAMPKDMRIQWCTTLYVNPKYEGRGYAYVVLQQLIEIYGDSFFDLDAAEASQANIRYTGLVIDYINQYVASKQPVKLPYWMPRVLKNMYIRSRVRQQKEKTLAQLRAKPYTLEYTTFMDDATYSFIQKYSQGDLFLRRQESFTWMLQHAFRQEAPSEQREEANIEFTGHKVVYRIYGVRVLCVGNLVGFYILRNSSDDLSIKYLYYDPVYKENVFSSIIEHLILMDNYLFVTHHKPLMDYVSRMDQMYKDVRVEQIAFSHPASFIYDAEQQIQGGDGDMLI